MFPGFLVDFTFDPFGTAQFGCQLPIYSTPTSLDATPQMRPVQSPGLVSSEPNRMAGLVVAQLQSDMRPVPAQKPVSCFVVFWYDQLQYVIYDVCSCRLVG